MWEDFVGGFMGTLPNMFELGQFTSMAIMMVLITVVIVVIVLTVARLQGE